MVTAASVASERQLSSGLDGIANGRSFMADAPGVGLIQQPQRNVGLGLKRDVRGNVRFLTPVGVFRPGLTNLVTRSIVFAVEDLCQSATLF